jgi:hypothetical protein
MEKNLFFQANMNDKLLLNPIEPNFEQFESKDFFNLIVSDLKLKQKKRLQIVLLKFLGTNKTLLN